VRERGETLSKRERERVCFFLFFSCISVTLFWSFNKLQQEPPLIPKKKDKMDVETWSLGQLEVRSRSNVQKAPELIIARLVNNSKIRWMLGADYGDRGRLPVGSYL
jgi:hypothetical protein